MSNDWTNNENVGPKKADITIINVSTHIALCHLASSCLVFQDTSCTNHMQLRRARRSRIPDKPNYSLNLWSIMKNCIGKDLSKIPMPASSFLNEGRSYMDSPAKHLHEAVLSDYR